MKFNIKFNALYHVYCFRSIDGPIDALRALDGLIGGDETLEQARSRFCCGTVRMSMVGTISSNLGYRPGETICFEEANDPEGGWDSTFRVDELKHFHGQGNHRPWISVSREDYHYMPFNNPRDDQSAVEVLTAALSYMFEGVVSHLIKRGFDVNDLSVLQAHSPTSAKYFDDDANKFPSQEWFLNKAEIKPHASVK